MSAEHRRIRRGGGDRLVRSVRRWVEASGSGCCARRSRPGSSTARRGEDLAVVVVGFFDGSERVCGCRRVRAGPARGGVEASLGVVRGIVVAAGPVACRPLGDGPGWIVSAPDLPGRPGRLAGASLPSRPG